MMKLCKDIIGEILKFSDDLTVHMNTRMLCKELSLWLKEERYDTYKFIMFTVKNVKCKIPGWISGLKIKHAVKDIKLLEGLEKLEIVECDNVSDEDLKWLDGIKYLSSPQNKKITDKGLVHLKGIHNLNLRRNENITDKGLVHLKGIHTLDLTYNKNITD
jgi:hypothetical protein